LFQYDHFELACRNGEIIRVLFAIDACDREIIAWSATTAGISGEMVRDSSDDPPWAFVALRLDRKKT
jgi:transposase InsO family protein